MSKSFNPFYEVMDESYDAKKKTGTKYVHAATLRKSFLNKMATTFNVFFGNHFTSPEFYGLLDYAMLMVPSVLLWGLSSYKPNNFYDQGTYAVAWVVWGILTAVKGVFAALLTLSVAPIVAGVHLVSGLLSRSYRAAIEDIRVSKGEAVDNSDASGVPLKKYIQDYDLDNSNALLEMNIKGNTNSIILSINKLYDNIGALPALKTEDKLLTRFELRKDANGNPVNERDYRAFKALLKMNASPSSHLYAQWKQIKRDSEIASSRHLYEQWKQIKRDSEIASSSYCA